MLSFKKNYFSPNTFVSKANNPRDLEYVEMASELPFYAASVQLEDGSVRWLLLAGPRALARAHEGLADGIEALAVYQLKPNFKDGMDLVVKRVTEWDGFVRIVTDEHSFGEAYCVVGKVLSPIE